MELEINPTIIQEALMFLNSSFAVVLQELAVVMTVPSFQSFMTVLTG
jgi:hypothetical protein